MIPHQYAALSTLLLFPATYHADLSIGSRRLLRGGDLKQTSAYFRRFGFLPRRDGRASDPNVVRFGIETETRARPFLSQPRDRLSRTAPSASSAAITPRRRPRRSSSRRAIFSARGVESPVYSLAFRRRGRRRRGETSPSRRSRVRLDSPPPNPVVFPARFWLFRRRFLGPDAGRDGCRGIRWLDTPPVRGAINTSFISRYIPRRFINRKSPPPPWR